ncbi:MAG TPA: aminotransferase class I/II-fold pyridoxal phosphate-dependent enzyme, partial [Acidimicrobiales bacterium]|nr:aminotransferase class I/II-fold pyridoxal phosphate-dependent enzyme [Acidimicrobiales bacterium]
TGDEVLVIGPSPQSDDDVVRQAGGTIRHVPWPDQDSSSDAWLGSAISNRTRAVLLRTPSLTGVSLFDGSARAVLAKVQAHNSTVISVEGLSDFGWHGYRHRGFAATADAHRRTVTIGDFSAWGLDGWRVGYLLGPAPLVAPMTNFKQALSICSPALGQYAALAAATGPQTHLDDLRSDLESRSQAIAGELERFGIPIPAVEAGFHLFLPTNAVRGDPTPDILSAASVRVAAGDDFRVPGTIRITLSQPPPVLVEAVRRIAPWLSGTGEGTRRG